MSDIFREVDEALSREKAARFWKSWGPTLVLTAILMVASTAIATGYQTWDGWRDRQETAELLSAAQAADPVPALEKAATDTRDGHEAIALMAAASKSADDKNFVKAAELYAQVAADDKAGAGLSDLAAIMEVRSSILAAKDKAPDYAALVKKVEVVAQDEKSPYRLQAKVEAALLYGDGLKDYAKALTFLDGFDGDDVPASLKEKADALKHVYSFEKSASGK